MPRINGLRPQRLPHVEGHLCSMSSWSGLCCYGLNWHRRSYASNLPSRRQKTIGLWEMFWSVDVP